MKYLIIGLCAIAASISAHAQERKVTPVENEDGMAKKPQLHYYDKHGNPLKEPVLIWAEDTVVKTRSKPVHPLYSGLYVGVNIFDAILQAASQSYGSYDVWGQVSLYNWFLPTIEAGLGYANSTPAEKNFTYKCPPSFYCRIGFDYNFLYNSTPDYSPYIGFRTGFTSFTYDIENITVNSDYWQQTEQFSLPGQKSTAIYGEVLAGLRVKIINKLSLGWSVRYKFPFHVSNGNASSPWFIPGYGARNAHFSGSFSIIYNI